MFSSIRPGPPSDSPRSGAAVVELDEYVEAADKPSAQAHMNLVTSAPGAAILLWGPDALCLAYNRHYRTLAALRVNALGRPLFKTQPDLEKTWRAKFDQVLSGVGVTIDGSSFGNSAEGGGREIGWLLPVPGGDGTTRGALGLFIDVSTAFEPLRRIVAMVAQDLRDPLIGVRVLAERLERAPKLSRERAAADMLRVLELTAQAEQIVDDMGAYARASGASGGMRINPIQSDLGAIVRDTCEKLNEGPLKPVRVSARESAGLWDPESIRRIVTSLVAGVRRYGPEDGEIVVEVTHVREGISLTVRDNGGGMMIGDPEQLFEPWKRGGSPADRRRAGSGLGLFLAKELIQAHGGRVSTERAATGSFMIKVVFPVSMSGSGLYRAALDRRGPDSGR